MSREQKIRDRAYALWEAEGRPHGREHQHWLTAEREIGSDKPGDDAAGKAKAARKPPVRPRKAG